MLGRLWRNPHYRFGVAAQFFNVGAQVCVWSFTIQYATDVVGVPTKHAGWYLQASLLLFLVARFAMTYLLGIFRPTLLLFLLAALGVGLALTAMFSLNMVGLLAVVAISLSLSLMFPTIYGVSLQGLGEDTKFGAAGLVMAILGGALMPPIMGKVMDQDPEGGLISVMSMLRRVIAMPGRLMFDGKDPDLFEHFAADAQRIGAYTANDYADIVGHLVKAWDVAGRTGLSGKGARAQDFLCTHAAKCRAMAGRVTEAAAKQPPVRFRWVFDRAV